MSEPTIPPCSDRCGPDTHEPFCPTELVERIINALTILERNLPWEREYLVPVLKGEMVLGEVRAAGDDRG